jgi:MASE9 protein
MKTNSQRAMMLTGLMATTAIVVTARALSQWHPRQYWPALMLMAIAAVASRFKLKLPGLNSNMSVNLPFILIATVELPLFEALMVSLVSIFVQCYPEGQNKLKAMQLLFNLSSMAMAVDIGSWVFRHNGLGAPTWASTPLLLVLVAAGFFCAQTIPVAAVIALTEGGKLVKIWSSIVHLSFPYYVLSAGVTSIVATASAHLGWQIPLLTLPVMYGVYHSFRLYFRNAVAMENTPLMARSASAAN